MTSQTVDSQQNGIKKGKQNIRYKATQKARQSFHFLSLKLSDNELKIYTYKAEPPGATSPYPSDLSSFVTKLRPSPLP